MEALDGTELDDLSFAIRLVRAGAARALRERTGLRQSDVARHLGVGRALVNHWESCRRVPAGRVGAMYGALLRRWS
ncbi:MAG: helix-turn-helix domain-containing protein [Candidatus Limnocylindrales bacterium]